MRLADVVQFMAQPRFIATRTPIDAAGLGHLMALFGLTVLLVIIVTGLIWPIILSGTGGEMPSNANDSLLDMDPGRLVLTALVFAPVVEEIIFRSWLGGRRSSVLGFPILATGLTILSFVGTGISATTGLGIAAVLIFLTSAVFQRGRALDDGAFLAARERLFPAIFWGTAVLFGLIHLANFGDGVTTPLLILAVTPQVLVGLVLGYVRLRFGLIPAIGFHAAYNALFIAFALFAQGMVEAGAAEAIAF